MRIDWADARLRLTSLTEEEQLIVNMLIDGKTLPDIGKALGQHRSMIWRKVEKIKKRLSKHP
jgi:DNA-binding NarL/FixJ family response regulator